MLAGCLLLQQSEIASFCRLLSRALGHAMYGDERPSPPRCGLAPSHAFPCPVPGCSSDGIASVGACPGRSSSLIAMYAYLVVNAPPTWPCSFTPSSPYPSSPPSTFPLQWHKSSSHIQLIHLPALISFKTTFSASLLRCKSSTH